MAIYKPSHFSPQLQEIEIVGQEIADKESFSCVINTSGESVKAYKLTILSGRGDEEIYNGEIQDLATPIKNKGTLTIPGIDSSYGMVNGKDYLWGIRVYNQPKSSPDKPNTKVCDGFLVGSTKTNLWIKLGFHKEGQENKSIADKLVYDRYIQFDTDSSKMILGYNDGEDKTLPEEGVIYTERQKIDWVDKELGENEDFIKIETQDPFTYNYINGTPFTIYKCSDKHTVNSFFADPNTNVNVASYVVVYNNIDDAISALQAGDNPGTAVTVQPAFGSRKIVGYSSDTGEVRVHDSFESAPTNGMVYRIFEKNVSTGMYTEILASDLVAKIPAGTQYYQNYVEKDTPCYKDVDLTEQAEVTLTIDTPCTYIGIINGRAIGTVSQGQVQYYVNIPIKEEFITGEELPVVDFHGKGVKITIESIDYYADFSSAKFYRGEAETDNPYQNQIIGGTPIEDEKFVIQANDISDDNFQLFIQPNINIKTDEFNPNEIVFDNGCRVDIIKKIKENPTTGKIIDITFEKLDNTQWLLTSDSLSIAEGEIPVDFQGHIQPQTPYTVCTDFMDSMPFNLIYARKSPEFKIQYRDLNMPTESYKNFNGDPIPLRNIQFKTSIYNDKEHNIQYQQGLKYYQYTLYVVDDQVVTEIAKSNEIYAADLDEVVWGYRGFMTEVNHVGILQGTDYRIKISIVNENDHEFSYEQDFFVKYNIEGQATSLQVQSDCNLSAIRIIANAPEYSIPSLPNIRSINIIQTTLQNIYSIDKNEEDCYYFVDSITYRGVEYEQGYHHYYVERDEFGTPDQDLFDCDIVYYNTIMQEFKNQTLEAGKYYDYRNVAFIEHTNSPRAVTVDDLAPITASDNGDYVILDGETTLYYDSVLTDDFPQTKIELPINGNFLTQFQLTPDFIRDIPLEFGDPDAESTNNKSEILSIGYYEEVGQFNSGIMYFKDASLQDFLGYIPINSDDDDLLPDGHFSRVEKMTDSYSLVTGIGYFVKASDIIVEGDEVFVNSGTEYFFSSTCYPATKAGVTTEKCVARKFDASKIYGTIFINQQVFIKTEDVKNLEDELHYVTLYLHNCSGQREVYVAPKGTYYYKNPLTSDTPSEEAEGMLATPQFCWYNNQYCVYFESTLGSSTIEEPVKYYVRLNDIPIDQITGTKVTKIVDPQKAQLQMYDDQGKKLKCFKVNGKYVNNLNLMSLLYGIPEIEEYKFALQNDSRYITLIDKESGKYLPFPEVGQVDKYYIYYPVNFVKIENGQKVYETVVAKNGKIPKDQNGRYPGVYKYDRIEGYRPAGLETLYIYSLRDADGLGIGGWEDLTPWERYNLLGVPTHCRVGLTKKLNERITLYSDQACTQKMENTLPSGKNYIFEFATENVGRILFTWNTFAYFKLKEEERNYVSEYNIIWNDSLVLNDINSRTGVLTVRANQELRLYNTWDRTSYVSYTPTTDKEYECQYLDENTVIIKYTESSQVRFYYCDSKSANGNIHAKFNSDLKTNYTWVDNSYHSYTMLLEMLERESDYSDQQWISMYLTITTGYNQNKYECTMKNSNPRWKSIDV